MKKLFSAYLPVLILCFVLIVVSSVILFAYPGGITGLTRKTSTQGCHCHTQNTSITGLVTGPDTVVAGTTNTYTITISRSGYSGSHGGVDIAVRLGTLDTASSGGLLRVQNGELTHINPLTFNNGTASVSFNYIAPSTAGIDTIWSNVVAGYSNGWNYSPEKRVIVNVVAGVQNQSTPVTFKLNQNYPNPFNPVTKITFELPEQSKVSLKVYNILGCVVDDISPGRLNKGFHEVNWNAENFASGVYFYTLKADNYVNTKQMVLIK